MAHAFDEAQTTSLGCDGSGTAPPRTSRPWRQSFWCENPACQDEYSLVVREAERDLLPAMRAYGLGLLPYFPLASGLLTGKYRRNMPLPEEARLTKTQRLADRYLTEKNWEVSEKLIDFAEARGRKPVELAFNWLLAQAPVASVIAGATKPEQVEDNAKAGAWTMTGDDFAEIDRITLNSAALVA